MRTKGSLGKPKMASIKLGELNKLLNENALIPVDIKFLKALISSNNCIKFEELKVDSVNKNDEKTIEYNIIEK